MNRLCDFLRNLHSTVLTHSPGYHTLLFHSSYNVTYANKSFQYVRNVDNYNTVSLSSVSQDQTLSFSALFLEYEFLGYNTLGNIYDPVPRFTEKTRITGKIAEIPERPKNNSETLIGDHY